MYANGKSKGYPVEQNIYLFLYMISLLTLFGNFYGQDRKRERVDEGVKVKRQ